MKIATMFIWIVVPFLAIAAHNSFGSPHMLFSYTFLDNGDRHNLAVPGTSDPAPITVGGGMR
ncbi:hypothetical protein NBRC116601_11830 [Cognatishimia sp. WU-CL00825]|uniref:hypothetical protein n=1 Tax=Cognatishimia sp. WU-CL00825 TaxID=3127658 RepID=UPI0031081EF5